MEIMLWGEGYKYRGLVSGRVFLDWQVGYGCFQGSDQSVRGFGSDQGVGGFGSDQGVGGFLFGGVSFLGQVGVLVKGYSVVKQNFVIKLE